ncbi:hypothetical protein [Nonomuraea recticatena]
MSTPPFASRFDLIADFTCEFFTPYAVSFDYGRMRMSVGRDVER